MNLSLGEFRALVAKAFRGAGYSWGLTEDASFAAMRLAQYGVDAGAVVVRLLEVTEELPTADLMPDPDWHCAADVMCPICVGASIADAGGCTELVLDRVVEPVLIAPFLVEVIEADAEGYVIEWDGGRCDVTHDGLAVTGSPTWASGPIRVTRQAATLSELAHATRVELDEATKAAIETFAHRTYAPATEASRLAGAGAGLSDND